MQRRKLTTFTIMYIAGIAAGYFMLEKSRPAESLCFMTALAASVFLSGGITGTMRSRIVLIAFMILGFALFSLRCEVYRSFESENNTVLTGTVRSATLRDGTLRLRIRPAGADLLTPYIYMTAKGFDGEPYELVGRDIRSFGEYRKLRPADDPGCFDERLYRRSKGEGMAFKGSAPEIISDDESIPRRFRRKLYKQRELFINRFDDATRGFIRGVIFGDKSDLDDDLKREFNINQTGHILAVSGLHIGFLYSLLRMLSGRRKTIFVSSAVIAVLLIYGEMTMWSPATLRACMVLSISLISVHFRKNADLLTSVSLSALLILIYQPYQMFDPGFQMSFLAMAGIALFSRPISAVLGEILGTAAAVQLGVAPVSAYTFFRANLLSIFINIPIIMLSSIIVPLCIMLLFVQIVLGSAPVYGIAAVESISKALININHTLSFGGGFSVFAAGLGAFTVIAFYVLSFCAATEWMRIRLIRKDYRDIGKAVLLLTLPLLIIMSCCYDSLSDDEIVFVSVGQGDCTHIRAGSHDFLIDGGGSEDYNVGENILMPYLLRSGADAVDAALATHLHTDHFKGIEELEEIYPVGAIGIPSEYRRYAESELFLDADIIYIGPGTVISTNSGRTDISIEVLWPVSFTQGDGDPDDANEHNTVYMIRYGEVKVMVTGDMLEEDELEMLKYYKRKHDLDALKCDVLKVAHHGSKSSSSEAFLDAADPSVAVISVGRDNCYGHPHAQTLDRLNARGIKIYRTDINGAVGIDIRNGKMLIDRCL